MKKGFKSGLLIFIILLLITGGISAYCIFSSRNSPNTAKLPENGNPSGITFSVKSANSSNTKVTASYSKQYVAALYVEGTIEEANTTYNQKWLLSTISALANDTNNVAIALYINSPGGAVYQADEVYLALEAYRKLGKPIYCYMGATAASGGYYIACPSTKIYANRNTMTGSIGVIAGQFIDITELLDNVGIKIDTIHSGKNKLMGSYYEPMTKEQEQIMQKLSDECYDQFVSIVAQNRPLTYKEAVELADGRVYTAVQAVKNKLIDKIDSWDNMINDLFKTEFEGETFVVKTFKYEHKPTMMESLMGVVSSIQNKKTASSMGIPETVLEEIQGFNSYPAYILK